MSIYPGYDVDPRVRKVVDRCVAIGMKDFHKPYSNRNDLYKFTTLERDLCIPSKLPMTEKEKRQRMIKGAKPGTTVILKEPSKAQIKLKPKPKQTH